MTDPQGPAAASIAGLWWFLAVTGGIVYVVVLVLLGAALRRSRKAARGAVDPDTAPRFVGTRLLLWGGLVVPAVLLSVITGATVAVGRTLTHHDDEALRIHVVGEQFWWRVTYPDLGFETANEIHIPAGEPVDITLTSPDVIHSFWVPQLHGKIDLVPGRTNRIRIEADDPGSYQGRCAEFCGVAHAHMRFLVDADEPEVFERWADRQAEPAVPTDGELAEEGRDVFLGSACVYCHTVRGTNANSEFGPDLTHLASRETLGAGVLENNRGNLGGWLLDPQEHKPGNRMPATALTGEELQAILAYLEGLE